MERYKSIVFKETIPGIVITIVRHLELSAESLGRKARVSIAEVARIPSHIYLPYANERRVEAINSSQ
jgi:hypothetical protein